MINVGKQILKDLLEDVNDDLFWSWFVPSDYFSQLKKDGYSCNLCDYKIMELNEDSEIDTIEDHVFEKHSKDLILNAIQKYFSTPPISDPNQTVLQVKYEDVIK
jgi:hypothetical protein